LNSRLRCSGGYFKKENSSKEGIVKILLSIDGSEHSARTVDEIGSHPWPADSMVRVLSVVDQVATATPEIAIFSAASIEAEREQLIQVANELTTRFANWLCSHGLSAETKVRVGDPKSVIIDEAREWAADLIVVGSHGRTGIRQWLLGSVAQSVVSQAPCSVYVVRDRDQHQTADPDESESAVSQASLA
jgi:nucleotide-binding universal stress UspA family protein